MAGGREAVRGGKQLAEEVMALGNYLGLEVRKEFKLGRRIWGAERRIDVVLRDRETRKTLGVECKFQGSLGSAEEKIPATIHDLSAWPIDGIVVFAGEGLTQNMKSYLISTGKAVAIEDLEPWLRLYFGLDLDMPAFRELSRDNGSMPDGDDQSSLLELPEF